MSQHAADPPDDPALTDLEPPVTPDPASMTTPIYEQLRREVWPPEETPECPST